jgi:transposase
MRKKKQNYSREFKTQAISLVRDAKRPASEVARELGINANKLYNWLNRANVSSPKTAGKESTAEIKRLKKALAQAEMERDILKKAAAYFAKETL